MEIKEKQLKEILEEQRKDFQSLNAVLYEKFRHDVKIISEGWNFTKEKVDKISHRLDATFEMVGGIKEDVEVIKMDVSFIKTTLNKKPIKMN